MEKFDLRLQKVSVTPTSWLSASASLCKCFRTLIQFHIAKCNLNVLFPKLSSDYCESRNQDMLYTTAVLGGSEFGNNRYWAVVSMVFDCIINCNNFYQPFVQILYFVSSRADKGCMETQLFNVVLWRRRRLSQLRSHKNIGLALLNAFVRNSMSNAKCITKFQDDFIDKKTILVLYSCFRRRYPIVIMYRQTSTLAAWNRSQISLIIFVRSCFFSNLTAP